MAQIKALLTETMGIPPVVILMAAGIGAHLLLNFLLGKTPFASAGLWLVLMLGITLEGYEIWVAYREVGLFAEGNDPLIMILLRHLGDVAVIVSGPLALVLFGYLTDR